MQTFYWHDYETWGTSPAIDRPSQFAGIRTDLEFNIIGEPLMIYCQPPVDLLPQPDACLITGITPQHAREQGLPEREFIAAIHAELARPGTCGVGYNSLRFDDEVTRYTLYRNFYDPYAREWQNRNSRWDIIDMVRACRTLRPEGIEWPDREDGSPSFKLEHLTAANGLAHEHAHDALSDVHATIAIARLIRQKQPKLFDYLFRLRSKREVGAQIDLRQHTPLLHISGMFGNERGCGALVMPLMPLPGNANGVVCYDLGVDPEPLLSLDAAEIRRRLFTPAAQLEVERIALKSIHLNRCPVVATTRLVDDTVAQRLRLDRAAAHRHYQRLLAMREELLVKLQAVYAPQERAEPTDPERMLYSGFFNDSDRRTMDEVRRASGSELASTTFAFGDRRLPELLFRYRARNFPETLNDEEAAQWRAFVHARLTDPGEGASIVEADYRRRLAELAAEMAADDPRHRLLAQLGNWADELLVGAPVNPTPPPLRGTSPTE